MGNTILNAAPMTNALGIQDLSTRPAPVIVELVPTHLPVIYGYAQKGPAGPQLVSGADATNMYGANTFDLRKPYATHQTVLANELNRQANAFIFNRVFPADAGPAATIALLLDVLPTTIPVYNRNPDGSYVVDATGAPVASGQTVPGFRVKWVVDTVKVDALGNSLFGQGGIVPGDQMDTATNVQSKRYPMMDLEVSSIGGDGNNQAIRLSAPTINSASVINPNLLINEMAYPFRLSCVSRPDSITSPSTVVTQAAEQFINFTFKPGTIDRTTDLQMYLGDRFFPSYQDLTTPNQAPQFGPFGKLHIYDANIDTVLKEFYAAELPYITGFSDFTGVPNEEYRFNFFSGVSSNAVPYTAFQVIADTPGSVRLTENTTIYAQGGSDGTMNEALFGGLVATMANEYGNPNSVLQDMAKYPESIIYDTGFPLNTKMSLANFIALRKDTAVVLSTHDVLLPQLTASEESSLAIALRTRLQMFPESTFYGTSTVRGMIVGRSGKLLNSQYTKPLPLTIEIASKAAAYMGASNGKWKAGAAFDMSPNNNVTMFAADTINITYTPASVRNKDWANGLVWVDSFDRRSVYFPAFKTVYNNDTSVLNSFFTMMACVELEKIGERARRQFSGVSSLTPQQIIDRVNNFVTDAVKDKFDSRFVIIPNTYFTAADTARGYSWSLAIQIYAPNMMTVMSLTIQSFRIGDLVVK